MKKEKDNRYNAKKKDLAYLSRLKHILSENEYASYQKRIVNYHKLPKELDTLNVAIDLNQQIIVSQMKMVRTWKGKSQSQFPGIRQAVVSEIERGIRRPSKKQIKIISEVLGCSPSYVFPEFPEIVFI